MRQKRHYQSATTLLFGTPQIILSKTFKTGMEHGCSKVTDCLKKVLRIKIFQIILLQEMHIHTADIDEMPNLTV